MMKEVRFLSGSTPEQPEYGYGDHVAVYKEGTAVFGSHASVCPNPFRVKDGVTTHWSKIYGWVDICLGYWECIEHHKYGKCLLINGGKEIPSRVPNPNHDGKYILTEILVHVGAYKCQNPRWRGSAGCPTIPRGDWPEFLSNFKIGDVGILTIKPLIGNVPERNVT